MITMCLSIFTNLSVTLIYFRKATKTASSNFMMNWLKPETKSELKTEEPDVKKIKKENAD